MSKLLKGRRGQAMTEVVLMFPMFMFFLFAFAKVFALLVLVQKIEIASFYAARRWQLESHRNIDFEGTDQNLKKNIELYVSNYLGYGKPAGKFLDLEGTGAVVTVERTQVWQVVTVSVRTRPINLPFYKTQGFKFDVTKYVPNRDRPIAFVLPGLN